MPRGFVNVLDWAYGDGANDDAPALQRAAAAAKSAGRHLWLPRTAAAYLLGSPVAIPAGVGLRSYGRLRLAPTFPKDRPALMIGTPGEANRLLEIVVDLEAAAGGVDWTSPDHVGVRLLNPQGCQIRIMAARGFTSGVELVADGGGGAFGNRIMAFDLADCRYPVTFDGRNGTGVRNNLLFNGLWRISPAVSEVAAGTERGLWRILSSDGSAAALMRNNGWQRASCEAPRGSPERGRKLFVLHSQGPMNELRSVRDLEQLAPAMGDAHLVADGPAAAFNLVQLGHQPVGHDKTIVRLNGAPERRNAVITRRDMVANIAVLGGVTG